MSAQIRAQLHEAAREAGDLTITEFLAELRKLREDSPAREAGQTATTASAVFAPAAAPSSMPRQSCSSAVEGPHPALPHVTRPGNKALLKGKPFPEICN